MQLKHIVFALTAFLTSFVHANEIVIFDAATTPVSKIRSHDGGKFELKNGLLTVTTKPGGFPGVTILGNWDVSKIGTINVEFVNGGIWGKYTLCLNQPGGNPSQKKNSYVARLPIKGEKHLVCSHKRPRQLPNWGKVLSQLKGVRTWALPYLVYPHLDKTGVAIWNTPGQAVLDALNPTDPIVNVSVYIGNPKLSHTWSIKRITATPDNENLSSEGVAEFAKLPPEKFFPCIDKYGQFIHREWPDKVHTDADFTKQIAREEKDLASHPGPKGWNKWGGWANGPKFEAKGHFYLTKHEGKWWFVDPDGCLWWSHGPVRVTPSSAITPLDDRLNWFAELPVSYSADPLAQFYFTRDELLFPYYTKRNIKFTYDFSAANLYRKYGKDWFNTYANLVHRRLLSWGCNTIANSSDIRICRMKKTPYTDRFELKSRPIEASAHGWWPFRDPFDPSFREEVRRQMALHKEEMDDVWCFGFFVDNELVWGREYSLALWSLQSPADQPAKIEFIKSLKNQYKTIDALNVAWKTSYSSWDNLLQDKKGPEVENARKDLEAFSDVIADAYYANIRDEFKKAAPNKLYMGCRYAGGCRANIIRIAAKHCDVISYNIYSKDLSKFKLPEGVDKPVIVGEFHFGALDRGPFCPGLILLKDQNERRETYIRYVRSALEHPSLVGVHWHQFSDQATSGRFEGENMQVGWTDVCDTPYWETIDGIRTVGYDLYQIRSAKK